jgi:hypothetical protein
VKGLTLFKTVMEWRWSPCVGLIASSLLYVLIAILVVPSEIATTAPAPLAASPTGTSTSPRSMGMSADGMDQPNSFPGGSRRGMGLGAPMNQPAPEPAPMVAPPPAPEPAPPPPAEEPPREEPPPPPPPPPAPPPPPQQEEEEAEEAPAEPAPTTAVVPQGRSRFMAAPLRFMPGNSPQNPAIPPPAEAPPDGE